MATDVRIGGYPSFEQVFFQNHDMAASPPSDPMEDSPCESMNGHVYETVYILPGEPELMDCGFDDDTTPPISSEETTEIQELYFTETEVHEAHIDVGCVRAEDFGTTTTTTLCTEDNGDHVMTSNMCVDDNGCIPFNVVKEEVVDERYGNYNAIGALQSSTVHEYCVSGTANGTYYSMSLVDDDGRSGSLCNNDRMEEYVTYHDGYGIGDVSSQFQEPPSSSRLSNGDEETDPLFASNVSGNASDTSSVSSSSKTRKRKKIVRKRSNGKKNDGTKVPTKECNSNGRKRTPRRTTSEDSSGTPEVKRGIEVNSLRYHVGPRLRYLAAVLEVTGVKHMADYLPYEIMRRYHPTNTYRTILKIIETPTNTSKIAFENIFPEEPDWKELENLDEEANFETENDAQSLRIYYKSPFGHDQQEQDEPSLGQGAGSSVLSIPRESEKNGKPTYSPTVISSVGSADLNVELDLESLATTCANTELQESLDMPLIIRLKEPKCCGLLYETGKLVVVGAQSFDDFRKAVRRFARMVQKSNYKVRLTNLVIHSYLGLAKLPFKINVTGLAQHGKISRVAKYDPSVIPGAIMFMRSTSIMCLIFSTGAVIMTDATSENDMKTTLDNIYPCLRLFGY